MIITRVKVALAALLLLGGAMTAGCGTSTVDDQGRDTSSREETSAQPVEPNGTVSDVPVTVYFFMGEKLVAAGRVSQSAAVAQSAVEQLLAGPDGAEAGFGVTSEIPGGTELLGISVAEGVATVDLSSAYGTGGGSFSMRGRLAQLVFTLTQFDTIDSVKLRLDGTPVDTLGGEGVIIASAQTRDEYEEFVPAVMIESPRLGGAVSSPLTVTGTANVFEATFALEVTDGEGLIIAERQVTASSGTGTRGGFETAIEWSGATSGTGAIIASYRSPKDGSRVVVSEIPVSIE